MVDLTQYLWIVWLVFILVCVIIELLTLDFTFLMIAAGSVAGLGANLLDWEWWVQILAAAVVSMLLLLLIRPVLLRAMARQSEAVPPSNIAALIGMGGRVASTVGDLGGLVKLDNGETWTAHLSPGQQLEPIDPGNRVRVLAIEGSTAYVAPSERT
jgi:membrane protein implicated in regulation of membrane protease activity